MGENPQCFENKKKHTFQVQKPKICQIHKAENPNALLINYQRLTLDITVIFFRKRLVFWPILIHGVVQLVIF